MPTVDSPRFLYIISPAIAFDCTNFLKEVECVYIPPSLVDSSIMASSVILAVLLRLLGLKPCVIGGLNSVIWTTGGESVCFSGGLFYSFVYLLFFRASSKNSFSI